MSSAASRKLTAGTLAGALLLLVVGCGSSPGARTPDQEERAPGLESPGGRLRVMTLNLGHGRGDRRSQLLLGREAIMQHLDRVAELLRREAPDVVALQEADDPSLWSGDFDHIEYLAERTGLPYSFTGSHSRSPFFEYGTALLSRNPLLEPESVSFPPSFPTPTKGYVRARVSWPGPGLDLEVEVVSVHLDFSREGVRREQARVLVEDLGSRARPVVLMGDLNGDWTEPGSIVQLLARELELNAYSPSEPEVSYPRGESRLDWILISEPLTFTRYETRPEPVSDHRAVVADLSLRGRR